MEFYDLYYAQRVVLGSNSHKNMYYKSQRKEKRMYSIYCQCNNNANLPDLLSISVYIKARLVIRF